MEETENNKVVIEVKDLVKSFGSNTILDGISLTLKKKENLVVLGKSGTGKSVLIKCIVGLLEPTAGEIFVLGNAMSGVSHKELNEGRKRIGFLFQSAALYDSMTVRENMEFPLRRTDIKISDSEITKRIQETLESVSLIEAIDKYPSELSGGMRKRAGLARTLVLKPEIILYDEPTTGLDSITSNEISKLINQLKVQYGTSSIIITHDMPCAEITSDRIMILNKGKVLAEGHFKTLSSSTDQFVRSFFHIN